MGSERLLGVCSRLASGHLEKLNQEDFLEVDKTLKEILSEGGQHNFTLASYVERDDQEQTR